MANEYSKIKPVPEAVDIIDPNDITSICSERVDSLTTDCGEGALLLRLNHIYGREPMKLDYSEFERGPSKSLELCHSGSQVLLQSNIIEEEISIGQGEVKFEAAASGNNQICAEEELEKALKEVCALPHTHTQLILERTSDTAAFSLKQQVRLHSEYRADKSFDGTFSWLMPRQAFFPLQKAPWNLGWIYYHDQGAPKIYVVIHPTCTEELERRIKEAIPDIGKCTQGITHRKIIPTLDFLKRHEIQISLMVQKEGEVAVILPRTYYFALQTGPGYLEKTLYAPKNWGQTNLKGYRRCSSNGCGPFYSHRIFKADGGEVISPGPQQETSSSQASDEAGDVPMTLDDQSLSESSADSQIPIAQDATPAMFTKKLYCVLERAKNEGNARQVASARRVLLEWPQLEEFAS
ncbi:unnamed protein product [Clonostachys solani]|uniref:JmjC domain-containing protein n=1 Tax=Clonostachys solani TaxID=160281 RepID=A0A9P0EHB0_9HYPO|nr:unnamed protein product [Clonostachys solani]